MPSMMSKATFVAAAALSLVFSSTGQAAGQAPTPHASLEFRVPSGAFLPAGDHRHSLSTSHVTAAQLSWVIRPQLAVTGTFGWARSRDVATVDHPKLDVFTSDVGIEVRSHEWFADGPVGVKAFAGMGGGMRSYNYRSLTVDATHNLAGYAAIGSELEMGRVGLRVEARDYLAGFQPLVGSGKSVTRNDVVIMAALSFDWN
jgi:hypothetical protein